MAKCHYCAAPLLANSTICRYCNTRNDVDLTGKHDYQIVQTESERQCPHCQIPLQTLDLKSDGSFFLNQCKDCFGLFFDNGQLEILLDESVVEVFQVNLQQLDSINQDRFQTDKPVKYIKCPVCQAFMSRHAFAYRSGVIIDQCNPHGIWLDSGEITHLLEWKRAGGQLLQNNKAQIETKTRGSAPTIPRDFDYSAEPGELKVLDFLATLIGNFIK